MFAAIARVELPEGGSPEEGLEQLENDVIPKLKEIPGVKAAYFLEPDSGNEGMAVMICEDEESASTLASSFRSDEGVRLMNVEVRSIIASA